ncbi:MAG: response regulator, partial [Deltaproteobacteria bacterium]|nr:response regulator [Deltaproteobacteria bacterium]
MNNDLNTRTYTILVVDDEIAGLRLLTDILGSKGYRVRPTERPQSAIESAMADPPDLILLDVKMPEMSGFEVCRRLKQEERTKDIPIIFVSGLQEIEDKIHGFKAGGVDFISKPFQESEILARVETHLHLHSMQMHLEDLVKERTSKLMISNKSLSAEIDKRQKV